MSDSANTESPPPRRSRGAPRHALSRTKALWRGAVRVARFAFWPKLDLTVRVWLAHVFLVSGSVKLMNWQTALDLGAHEYPVSFMSPPHAAYLGVSIEMLGGLLLAAGLLTRYAAVPLLCLSLVIQLTYRAFDTQLFWLAILGWYAIRGAGPLSLDALLRRGLRESAVPLAPQLVGMGEWVRAHIGPWYLVVLRAWLGCASLAAAKGLVSPAGQHAISVWLPVSTAMRLLWANTGESTASTVTAPVGTMMPAVPGAEPLAVSVAVAVGLALLLGCGTRLVASAALLTLSVHAMMITSQGDTVYLIMLFGILALFGAGHVSIDAVLERWLDEQSRSAAVRDPKALAGLPRVVIVGAGFGGIACATALKQTAATVTLIDRTNFHLFQPLLYQVATAALSPGDIAVPIRPIFRESFGVRVLLGSVTAVDITRRVVALGNTEIPYDYLVLATGATHGYFGRHDWARFAPGLKRIEDALNIRRKILTAFERAEASLDDTERASLLTFLVVGGGPTGVELAGAIAELARYGMDKEFRSFDPATARVILVQSGERLLPSFPLKLSQIARHSLEKLGVEVTLSARVEDIDDSGVTVAGQRIAASTVLWAAGVTASPAARWLGAEADGAGRVRVGQDMTVPGYSNIYAIGDTAASSAFRGQPVPGLAPAAKQGGAYVANAIRRSIEGLPKAEAFVYRHRGSLATIGRKAAVADLGGIFLWGAPAWWLWGIVHVGFLVGFRNRIATMVNWFWTYLTFGGGIRLITGAPSEPDIGS
jgi:NADH dehydrogenase/putative oxidoreductase